MKHDILANLVYILQAEHYDVRRFLIFIYKNWNWLNLSKRGKLVWTKRAKEIYFLSIILIIVDVYICSRLVGWWALLFIFFLPFYVAAANFVISPYIEYKKNQVKKKAKNILERQNKEKLNQQIKIIGITGSFGKTSCKNILESILASQFKVLKTPGNINTDMGIANFIIEHEKDLNNYDFLILEMSAYRIGDIAEICRIAPPEYSITTAIGLAHLERFGSLENIKRAKAELAENTKKKAFYFKDASGQAENVKFLDNFSGISFELGGQKFETKLLAEHNIPMIYMAIELAKELGESMENIKRGVRKIEQIKHRLEVIRNEQTRVTVIDDSYNGNYQGFVSGIEVLSRAKGRKVVLTPGIVELGNEAEKIHQKLAQKYLEAKIDLIMLIDNKNTRTIKKVFDENNFQNYKIYPDSKTAHADLPKVLQSGDTIIFQNDLSDNY